MTQDEPRVHLIDADTDERAALYYGEGWRSVDTLPDSGVVEYLTPLGLIRTADVSRKREAIRRSDEKGPRRVMIKGQSQAIAWRSMA